MLVVTLGELELAEKSNLITSDQHGSNKTKQFPDVGLTVETINNTNKKVNYLTICSPNYLHDSHIRYGLRNNFDVI